MRTRLLTIGAASMIALSAVVAVEAQRSGGPRRGGPPPASGSSAQTAVDPAPDGRFGPRRGGPGMPGARLDLTDDQQKTVSGIVQKSRDEIAPANDELMLARRNLHRELFADKRDNGKITSLTSRIAALEKEVLEARVKSEAAIADVLTPEQRQTARTAGFGLMGRPAGGRAGGARFGGPAGPERGQGPWRQPR